MELLQKPEPLPRKRTEDPKFNYSLGSSEAFPIFIPEKNQIPCRIFNERHKLIVGETLLIVFIPHPAIRNAGNKNSVSNIPFEIFLDQRGTICYARKTNF